MHGSVAFNCKTRTGGSFVGKRVGCYRLGVDVLILAFLISLKICIFSGGWEHWSLTYLNGKALEGSVVGFYGMGRIGESVAEKVRPFHPQKIIYHNRKPKENGKFSKNCNKL